MVARLRQAGAIVLGKTNVMADNLVYGPTFNPHDLTRSPGGSSSGEAAIIAAGGSALGLGSDSGGSLRQPAHMCGVATIKPTTGLVPLTGHFPVIEPMLDPRTAIGPIARSVEDLALALGVISGEDGRDPSVAPVPLRDWRDVDLSKLRIAWWIEQVGRRPDARDSGHREACSRRPARSRCAPDRGAPEGTRRGVAPHTDLLVAPRIPRPGNMAAQR